MATPTISEYTSHLRVDKSNMRDYLTTIGIETKESDTFTELTKAVDKIRTQAPQLYTQEEEPVVKQGIWLKGSNIVVNQVINDTDLYFKEELSYCGDNPLTAAHLATYYYYLYSEGQTYLLTYTNPSYYNDYTLYRVNPVTLALEFVIRAKTGVNCSLSRAFIRKNILYISHVAAATLSYIRFDMTTGEKLSNFLFDADYNNTTTSTIAWSSNAVYNEKYDALFIGEAVSNNYSRTYLHRYDFETGQYTAIYQKYGTRQSGFKLHAHPECILVNGSYYSYERQYTNVYKIASNTMVALQSYGNYTVGGFSNSAVLGGKTYLDIGNKYYNVFDYDVATDQFHTKSKVYWNEDQSALAPTISTVIPLTDRLILLNPATSNYTYYNFGGIDKVYPDKTLVLFQGNQINTAKFSTQLMPSALLSGKALVTPYNAIYYYTDEYGYNSPYPIYYGNGKRWVPVASNSSEGVDDYEPLLQDKAIDVTENGTTNVIADEGYDGLNSVEVNVNVESSGGKYTPRYISFYGYTGTNLNEELINIDTSNITNMSNMFAHCFNLTELNVSTMDTSNATDMSYMFAGSQSNGPKYTSLDLSNFNTSNVVDMTSMFYECRKVLELNLSNFDFSKVLSVTTMFAGCRALMKLDIRTFDYTVNLSNANNNMMFQNVPSGCLVIVKDEANKAWIQSAGSQLTVKTVAELEQTGE